MENRHSRRICKVVKRLEKQEPPTGLPPHWVSTDGW
jgi:hypothetical protein